MSFIVKVSEITPTVMLVIAGGVLLLALAGVRMYTQRKRLAAQTAEAEANGAADAEAPEAEAADAEAPGEAEKAGEPEGAGADGPGAEPGRAARADPSSRVTRHRTPGPKAATRRPRVRKWTVERCRGRSAGDDEVG